MTSQNVQISVPPSNVSSNVTVTHKTTEKILQSHFVRNCSHFFSMGKTLLSSNEPSGMGLKLFEEFIQDVTTLSEIREFGILTGDHGLAAAHMIKRNSMQLQPLPKTKTSQLYLHSLSTTNDKRVNEPAVSGSRAVKSTDRRVKLTKKEYKLHPSVIYHTNHIIVVVDDLVEGGYIDKACDHEQTITLNFVENLYSILNEVVKWEC